MYVQQFVEGGTLTFSVDGVTVTKQLIRYTFRLDSYAGTYLGAYKLTASGCTSAGEQRQLLLPRPVRRDAGANALSIVANRLERRIVHVYGRLLADRPIWPVEGSFTCANGVKGPHTVFEMSVTPTDFRGRLLASDNFGCSLSGSFSGIRQ
jgi:hypothetical protein